jgi:hypothetical protein
MGKIQVNGKDIGILESWFPRFFGSSDLLLILDFVSADCC